MLTGVGWVDFPVYSYSNDSPWSSTCTGSSPIWPAVLTGGHPGVSGGVSPWAVGTLKHPRQALKAAITANRCTSTGMRVR